ncbi:sensor histidine kinase [Paenibacillus fonticola]|uniref:sensor histidine kinase n=1 Tax=Paenibacillus fonticola TaxID=379896 RepID=UPI00036A6B77|nr:sensor histidine kinase [Paenibacillus fonticola]
MLFRNRKRRFRDFRLSSKLIIVYVTLTVLPMSLLGVISFREYTKSIVEQIGEYMPKFLDQANNTIDQHIEKWSALPEQLFNSTDVVRILRKDSYQSRANLNTDSYVVNNYLSRNYLEGSNSEILGVFILSKNRLYAASRMEYTGMDDEDLRVPYGQDIDLRGKAKLLISSDFGLKFDNNEPYLLIMKQIDDVENRTSLGTIFIAVKMSFIDGIVHSFENNPNAEFWLIHSEGEMFYHSDRAKIGSYDPEIHHYPVKNGSFRKEQGGTTWIMSISESQAYDWMLVHSIPLKELTQRMELAQNVNNFIFVGFALVTLIISIVFALRVTKPLERLSRLMKEVGKGRFDVNPQIHTRDEVGILAKSFTSMVSTIQHLIDKNVQTEISQKEAELYALQSQIHPHFIYNTLETISMAVEEGEKETVVSMVALMGRMLRFSVSNKSRWVTLAEEIAHAHDYLTIQMFRFEDRLAFDISVEADEMLFTPKFILQPVVENAVKYGMEQRQRLNLNITITEEQGSSGRERRRIVFKIKDNGPGIEAERLQALNHRLLYAVSERKDSGFGLENVNARIQYMLGQGYGVRLESEYGSGTTVIIVIPALPEAGSP